MKIKSKINGAISNVRGDIAREMVKLGVAEYAEEGVVTAPAGQGEESYRLPRPGDAASDAEKVEWKVVTISGPVKKYIAIQLKTLNYTHTWAGNPNFANATRTWPGGFVYRNGLGREIPKDILDQYVKACKANPNLIYPFSMRAEEQMASYVSVPSPDFPSNKRQVDITKENIARDRELTESLKLDDYVPAPPAIAFIGDDEAGTVHYEPGDPATGM